MPEPYFKSDGVELHLGDMREVLPALGITADLVLADPPYQETSLAWDRWPDGWLKVAAEVSSSLWCFGSLRMFGDRWSEFRDAAWALSQDLIWEKHNGSGFQNDRFKRVHEVATHWYRGAWADQHRDVPVTNDAVKHQMRRKARPTHMGEIGAATYLSEDGGPRLMRSVIFCRSMHGRALHPTEKPVGILDPLIRYACPTGGGSARPVRRIGLHVGGRPPLRPSRHRHRGRRDVRREGRSSPVSSPSGLVLGGL